MPEIVGLVLRLTMDTVCDTDQKRTASPMITSHFPIITSLYASLLALFLFSFPCGSLR